MAVRSQSVWLGILGFAWFCGSVCAQSGNGNGNEEGTLTAFYGDEQMISIATGTKQSIAQSPAVASVITADEIRAMGATDIDDVLETVPGLHVARNGLEYSPVYTFRGIYAQYNPQVLMLINGIPITNLFQGDRNLVWGGMPVQAIERIEVIRGPGSALYGADAFAGVINIITKTREDIQQGEAGLRFGSYDTRSGWLTQGFDVGEAQVALMLEYLDTDGQREKVTADAQTALDAVAGTHASAAPGPVSTSRRALDMRLDVAWREWRLRGGLQKRNDVGSGIGVADALDENGRYGSDRWNLDLTYERKKLDRFWDVKAQVSALNTSMEMEKDLWVFPPGTNVGTGVYPDGLIGNPEVFERHYRASLSAFYTGFQRHQWHMGVGYYYGDMYKVRETKNYGVDPATGLPLPSTSPVIDVSGTAYAFLAPGIRTNRYAYLQDVWNFIPDWELTAGARYDDFSDFGSTFNPRLALVWSTTQHLTSKLLYGKAFRSPSFAQMRNENNLAVLGNPKLDPETIETVEVAFDYHPFEQLRLGFNVFHYDWNDIIQFVPENNSTAIRAQNAGEQTADGGEFEITWQPLSTLKFNANYAYENAEDRKLDAPAANAPRQQVYGAVTWTPAPDWQLHTQANWVLDRKRAADDPRSSLPDYSTVDATLRRSHIARDWSVAFAVRNLFNSSPREPSPSAAITHDLPLARRNFYVELTYQLP